MHICVKGGGEDKLATASAHEAEHRVSRLDCVENHRVASVLTILSFDPRSRLSSSRTGPATVLDFPPLYLLVWV